MSPADLVIKNGRVATSSSLRSCAVAVRNGRISWIGANSSAPSADRVIDATGLVVLPGVIDAHVHMRDPGATYKEDFLTGTAAAAAGGVTLVFDMPNNSPPTRDVAAVLAKAKEASKKAIVDYALYGLLTVGNAEQVVPMADSGVVGFKWYMARTTGNVAPPSDGETHRDLAAVGKLGMRVAVHAEDDSVIRERLAKLKDAGRVDALAHYESRPEVAEERAVRRAISLAREGRCALHIAHLSSAPGAAHVRGAKRSGGSPGWLTAETCPQYLLLDKGDYPEKGSLMKCNPPVKRREDRLALWRAVRDGTIDMLATDHAPHTLEEKTAGSSIFDRASGVPGLETSVALMLTCVSRGLLTLSRYVRLTSHGPAKAWGLYPKKGAIALGSDADFTVVDLNREWTVDASRFVSKAKHSPFDGFRAKGMAVYTIVRGSVVMDHGALGKGHRGELQRPARSVPTG
ncbi:MAG: allantoinase AllB [Nitrososphaerota archaeon]|nr:allantoinase AllB [Nitrososphaerota archaeon]